MRSVEDANVRPRPNGVASYAPQSVRVTQELLHCDHESRSQLVAYTRNRSSILACRVGMPKAVILPALAGSEGFAALWVVFRGSWDGYSSGRLRRGECIFEVSGARIEEKDAVVQRAQWQV